MHSCGLEKLKKIIYFLLLNLLFEIFSYNVSNKDIWEMIFCNNPCRDEKSLLLYQRGISVFKTCTTRNIFISEVKSVSKLRKSPS